LRTFIIIFLSALSFCYSQNLKVSGVIRDANSGEALPYANISVKDESRGVSTNLEGGYELYLPPGNHELLVSYIGYKTETVTVELTDKDVQLNVNLISTGVLLQEVSVYAATENNNPVISSISLQSKEMEEISSVFPDVFRSIQSLPGIAVNNEFSAKFNVRGGNYDENLVLVNGSQVYEPFHIKEADNASVGIFNMDLMKKVNLITGGFSAQYGDRLSSVLNIEYREGDRQKQTGSVTLSLTNLDAVLEGPLTSRANYVLGLRKSYLEYILSLVDVEDNARPSFYDVQGAVTYDLTDVNKLQLKFIHAGDNFTYDPYTETGGRGNFTGTFINRTANMAENTFYYEESNANYYSNLFDLQNTLFLSSSAFLKTSVSYYYQIDREHYFETDDYNFAAISNNSYFYKSFFKDNYDQDLAIKTWEGKSSLDLKFNPFYDIKAGFSYINIKYDETIIDKEIQNITQNIDMYPDTIYSVGHEYDNGQNINASSYKLSGFVENIFQIGDNLILNAGGRFDYFDFNRDKTFSPRISASYRFGAETNIRAAWGYYYQSPIYRQLAYSTSSDTNTQSQKAEHYILGVEHNFGLGSNPLDRLTIKAEGYYKKYSDLISSERHPGGSITYSRKNDSKGYATGVDIYASMKLGSYYGWISYGLLFAKEDLLNDDIGEFPRYTDQRHTVSIVNDFNLGIGWSLNLRFTYGSGFAFTPYVLRYNTERQGSEWVEGEKNSEHLPAYRRIDIRIGKEFSMFNLPTFVFLDVNNLFNFTNINGYRYRYNSNGNPYRDDIELFPIIPSIGLTVKF
jgi:outer membrane receptor protein involved in Fe transport